MSDPISVNLKALPYFDVVDADQSQKLSEGDFVRVDGCPPFFTCSDKNSKMVRVDDGDLKDDDHLEKFLHKISPTHSEYRIVRDVYDGPATKDILVSSYWGDWTDEGRIQLLDLATGENLTHPSAEETHIQFAQNLERISTAMEECGGADCSSQATALIRSAAVYAYLISIYEQRYSDLAEDLKNHEDDFGMRGDLYTVIKVTRAMGEFEADVKKAKEEGSI